MHVYVHTIIYLWGQSPVSLSTVLQININGGLQSSSSVSVLFFEQGNDRMLLFVSEARLDISK